MRNPFEFGRELSADELVDRKEELQAVVAAMTWMAQTAGISARRNIRV